MPATQYALHADGAYGVGIEVRPQVMYGALVNLAGETRDTRRMALKDSSPAAVCRATAKLLDEMLAKAGINRSQLLGAGIVMPGPFGKVGLSGASQSELKGWDGVDPVAALEDSLGVPVVVENDATAAAVAERVSGVAKGLNSYCYIYFGTGLGLGVVADGQVLRGAFGNAGELGHVVVVPDGRPCACGNRGCLETYASRFAVRDCLAKTGITVESVKDLERLYKECNAELMDWPLATVDTSRFTTCFPSVQLLSP